MQRRLVPFRLLALALFWPSGIVVVVCSRRRCTGLRGRSAGIGIVAAASARIEGGDEFENHGGITQEVPQVLCALFSGESGGVGDDLRERFFVERKEVRQLGHSPSNEVSRHGGRVECRD
jgi:hypothetical protein